MLSLPHCNFVEVLLIHSSSRGTVFLRYDSHACTPSRWGSLEYWFDDTQCNVCIKLAFDLLFPMVRSWDRFVCSIGCVFVCKRYFEGFSTHHLQFLMRTCVKRTRRVTFLDLFLNLLSISIGHGASLVPLYFVESSDWVMFETDATGNSLSTMFIFLRAVSDKYIPWTSLQT